jgi:hypothetical protein
LDGIIANLTSYVNILDKIHINSNLFLIGHIEAGVLDDPASGALYLQKS